MKKRVVLSLIGLIPVVLIPTLIAVSCAEAVNNPSDQNFPQENLDTLETKENQPLTKGQIEYYTQMANDAKTKVDEYSRLDYSISANKVIVDQNIANYENEISKNDYYKDYDNFSGQDSFDQLKAFITDYYNNIKQRNLLPTQSETEKFIKDTSHKFISWQFLATNFWLFYSSPISWLSLGILYCLQNSLYSQKYSEWTAFTLGSVSDIPVAPDSPQFQAKSIYINLINSVMSFNYSHRTA